MNCSIILHLSGTVLSILIFALLISLRVAECSNVEDYLVILGVIQLLWFSILYIAYGCLCCVGCLVDLILNCCRLKWVFGFFTFLVTLIFSIALYLHGDSISCSRTLIDFDSDSIIKTIYFAQGSLTFLALLNFWNHLSPTCFDSSSQRDGYNKQDDEGY